MPTLHEDLFPSSTRLFQQHLHHHQARKHSDFLLPPPHTPQSQCLLRLQTRYVQKNSQEVSLLSQQTGFEQYFDENEKQFHPKKPPYFNTLTLKDKLWKKIRFHAQIDQKIAAYMFRIEDLHFVRHFEQYLDSVSLQSQNMSKDWGPVFFHAYMRG